MSDDYIGVFTPNGVCCGWAVWQEQHVSITVWGDNSQTPAIDGFQAGETVAYRIYRPSDASEWTFVTTAYSQGNGQYAPDAIMILSQFDISELSTISLNLTASAAASLSYHRLRSHRKRSTSGMFGGGKTRGDLFIFLLNLKLLSSLTGHVRWERFIPGNYYFPKANRYHWFRIELMYRF